MCWGYTSAQAGWQALPSSGCSPSILLAMLGVNARVEGGSQEICLVAGSQVQLLNQCPSLEVSMQRGVRLVRGDAS